MPAGKVMSAADSRPGARPRDLRTARAAARQRPERRPIPWPALSVIVAGGVLGAVARQGPVGCVPAPGRRLQLDDAGRQRGRQLPDRRPDDRHHRDLACPPARRAVPGRRRVGGFTTFSTYIVGIQKLISSGAPQTGLAYLAVTLAGALAAVYAGVTLIRLIARPRRKDRT